MHVYFFPITIQNTCFLFLRLGDEYEFDTGTLIVRNRDVSVQASSTQWIALEDRELNQTKCEVWFYLWRKLTGLNFIGLTVERCEKTIYLWTQKIRTEIPAVNYE